MRRAFVLAALAAPALVRAQTVDAGQIRFVEGDDDAVRGRFISKAECGAALTPNPPNPPDVELTWTVQLANGATGVPTDAQYQVYAGNRAHDATSPTKCDATPEDDQHKVGPVGGLINATTASATQTQRLSLAPFLTAAGLNCTPTGDTTIHVCVEGRSRGNTGADPFGIARGQLILSITAPAPPSQANASPGEGRLTVRWTAPGGTPEAYDFRVVAKSVAAGCADPANAGSTCAPDTRDTTVHQATSGVRTTEQEMGSLVNDVLYRVEVYSRSEAGNENDATPATGTGTPVLADNFWEYYQRRPGAVEEGGCAAGTAGPLALLAVAGLVAALRRRK